MVASADRRLFWLLSLAYRRAAGMADAGLEDLGLTAAQAGALFAIPVEGAASVNDMAATLRIAQSAASAFAQKLEKSGLVSRRANPSGLPLRTSGAHRTRARTAGARAFAGKGIQRAALR